MDVVFLWDCGLGVLMALDPFWVGQGSSGEGGDSIVKLKRGSNRRSLRCTSRGA